MKAEVYPSPDGWRFRVRGDNDEIMAVGESYVRRIDAEQALKILFNPLRKIDVTVRDHGDKVINHYLVGPPETAYEVIADVAEMEDDNPRYPPPGADPNEPYPHPDDEV